MTVEFKAVGIRQFQDENFQRCLLRISKLLLSLQESAAIGALRVALMALFHRPAALCDDFVFGIALDCFELF